MKLRTKMLGGFVLIALLTLGVGGVGWFGMHRMAVSLKQNAQLEDTARMLLQREIDHLMQPAH